MELLRNYYTGLIPCHLVHEYIAKIGDKSYQQA